MLDFVRDVILEEIFAPCVVYSVNSSTDEVRNEAVEHENGLYKDVNNHSLIPTMKNKKIEI